MFGPVGLIELVYIAAGLAVLAAVWRWGYAAGKAEATKARDHSIS